LLSDARPAGEKDEVAQVAPTPTCAEVEFGERASIAIVLGEDRQRRVQFRQPILNPYSVPTGEVRWVKEDALLDVQRAGESHADCGRASPGPFGYGNNFVQQSFNLRQFLRERQPPFSRHRSLLYYLAAVSAFDHSSLRPAHIYSQHRRAACCLHKPTTL
jgi:hypothetical protein